MCEFAKGKLWVLLWFAITPLLAQTDDNISWTSVKFGKQIDEYTNLSFRPIFRLEENLSKYQNTSVDFAIKRALSKEWSVQLLSRTWFIPERGNRQFIWTDISYVKRYKDWKLDNTLRMHYALDVHERDDPDFLRWKIKLFGPSLENLRLFLGFEPWWRFNGQNCIQRWRYEPGLKYNFSKRLDMTFTYRREVTQEIKSVEKLNIYILTIGYSIP